VAVLEGEKRKGGEKKIAKGSKKMCRAVEIMTRSLLAIAFQQPQKMAQLPLAFEAQ
jgi:hypothetical protein